MNAMPRVLPIVGLLAAALLWACPGCEAPQEYCRDQAVRANWPAAPQPAWTPNESYQRPPDNPVNTAAGKPLSTFSIDVDTASYSNVRRFLSQGQLPPLEAVRIEEMINYFPYAYAPPPDQASSPLSVHLDSARCPWAPEHRLVRVAVKGRDADSAPRPPANLVFLIDVSGSMREPNKLPLVQTGMRMLVNRLTRRDRVAIVTYSTGARVAMESTSCNRRERIFAALDDLHAGGSTNGGDGIRLAYRLARTQFRQGGVNRVILCTDGDFNVGTTSQDELVDLIQREADTGVYLTVLGFGMGNLKDSTLETLADKGHGNYAYIDSIHEARKALVDQAAGTLVPVARDVKLQVEFNPAAVDSYRLLGYENRTLAARDFNNDDKDAGDLGQGQTVTAFYEVALVGASPVIVDPGEPGVDALKYQPSRAQADEDSDDDAPRRSGWGRHTRRPSELLTLKLRYKDPDGDASRKIQRTLADDGRPLARADEDFRFAAAVAAFGMILGESPQRGSFSLSDVQALANSSRGADPEGYRAEFVQLVRTAAALKR